MLYTGLNLGPVTHSLCSLCSLSSLVLQCWQVAVLQAAHVHVCAVLGPEGTFLQGCVNPDRAFEGKLWAPQGPGEALWWRRAQESSPTGLS